MSSDPGSAPTPSAEPSDTRRARGSHRADASAVSAVPRPLRYALGTAVLAVALVGSLSFAHAARPSVDDGGTDVADVAGRDDVWSQVSRDDGVRDPLTLDVGDPVTFSVSVDGRSVDVATQASTLAEALVDAGIVVDLDDVVSAPMGEPPTDGASVTVERVGTQIETEVTTLAFDTVELETSRLPAGTTRVETEGVEGSVVTTYETTYADGEVAERVEIHSVVAAEPVEEVVLVGTGSAGSGSSGGSSAPQPVTYSGADPRAIAQEMIAAYGWGSDQWTCLNSLWQRESNWNPYAENRSSGAYGIPQALPGSKMASAGSDWRTNPATQIAWGLRYIDGRYGSPCGAWAHSESHNWY